MKPKEHGQAKVEAASIALILDLTRPWLWDRLDSGVRERAVEYLAQVVGDRDYPRDELGLVRSWSSTSGLVRRPWSGEDIESDLATHETFVRDGGWYCDGEERSFDHYCGWALHLYPILWSRMAGADQMAAPRLSAYKERLDRYLLDAASLVAVALVWNMLFNPDVRTGQPAPAPFGVAHPPGLDHQPPTGRCPR